MTDSYIVKKVGFTGSTPVGKTVMRRWVKMKVKIIILMCPLHIQRDNNYVT